MEEKETQVDCNEKARCDIPQGQQAYTNANTCNLGGSLKSDSEIVRRLRERREQLSIERRKIQEQIEALTDRPPMVSMNDVLSIVESLQRPIEIR